MEARLKFFWITLDKDTREKIVESFKDAFMKLDKKRPAEAGPLPP